MLMQKCNLINKLLREVNMVFKHSLYRGITRVFPQSKSMNFAPVLLSIHGDIREMNNT